MASIDRKNLAANAVTDVAPSAVAPRDRLAAIDILRGVALFGVMAVNLVNEFRVSLFRQFLSPPPADRWPDRVVEAFVTQGLELKAFALFSFLFGVGLAIQHERLSLPGQATRLLARRLAVLLLFGLGHLLFIWNGDILVEYALAGFIVLPFLRAPRWLLGWGCAVLLGLYLVLPQLNLPIAWPDAATLQRHVTDANRVYATGGLGEVWKFSIGELPLLMPLHLTIFPRTVALLLLGVWVWRTGLLRDPGGHKPGLALAACLGIGVGGALTAGAGPESRLAPIVLAAGYGAAVLWLVRIPVAGRALDVFAPIGRMAFTGYVMQSLIFGYIFFGYGLGQFGRLGAAQALALGMTVFVAQMLFSRWWLGRCRFGPLEWLWRTMMYGRMQSMALKA